MSSTRPGCAAIVLLALALGGCDQPPAQQATPAQQPASAAQSTPAQQPALVEQPAPASQPNPPAATSPAAQPASAPASEQVVTDPSSNDAVKPPPITDEDIPPPPITPFPAARPMETVRAVYAFAAKHPEVLNQVPCFCGCQNIGHRHNDDCFVKARDSRGVPTAWEPHGVG